ncbi:hypothetical protein DIE04_18995 [Burkholderia sp. Bp8994]|uniref:hypothetical protein n=1 Tax=Burkholderia sp. Bp8994 TaxID=2184555 RepID=UPI000F595483|nr:hypothetical protein [Burkholderia sp. Bp8994]RQR94543.1 hypothetical protein DIE04_18995 [Burkholderia sp. Bp8994]
MSSNASARPEQSTDIRQLLDQIESIDSMCQTQLGQINATITSTLRAMESQEFWRNPLVIMESLGLMEYLASDLMNFVNVCAEEVGSNFVDEIDDARKTRILAAYRAAANAGVNHG